MRDFLEFFLPLILAAALLLFGVVAVGEAYSRYQCRQFESLTGMKTRYSAFDACYVQRNGRFWRYDEYKLAFAAGGELLDSE